VYSPSRKRLHGSLPGCGALTFFRNSDLLERLNYGGSLCTHKLELKPCTGGKPPGVRSAESEHSIQRSFKQISKLGAQYKLMLSSSKIT